MTSPICSTLDEFADGELDAQSAAAFRDHLPECELCKEGLGDLLQLGALAARAAAKRFRVPPATRAAFEAAVARAAPKLAQVVTATAPQPHPTDTTGLGALWARAAAEQASRSGAPPPPVEGPGLRDLLRRLADLPVQPTPGCTYVISPTDRAAVRRALAAEEAREKLRREAAEAWAAGRARGYQLTPQEIETIGRWAAAVLGSAP